MASPPVVLMVCFARSGGTLLNRCLGSLPGVVMLSEVSPFGGGWGRERERSLTTVRAQALNWYGIDLSTDDFYDGVWELADVCAASGRRLVVREWAYASFVAGNHNDGRPPRRLATLEALSERGPVVPFAFVRDAIDVWISRGMPDIEAFCADYGRYVDAVLASGMPVFKYEDFCRDPGAVIAAICAATGLEFSEAYRDFASFDKANGDLQIPRGARDTRTRRITPVPRKRIGPEKVREIEACPEMGRINRALGYPPSYRQGAASGGYLGRLKRLWSR